MRPLNKRVLVIKQEEKKQTASGLLLPEGVSDGGAFSKGTILEISKDCEYVKQGDVVIFPKFTGTEVRIGDTVGFLLFEKDLLAVEE